MKVYTIKFYFYGTDVIVPFNYGSELLSFLHRKILGENNSYHDSMSLYSISPLFGSKTLKNGLLFKKGAIWLIRTPSIDVFKNFYLKAKNRIGSEFINGFTLKNVEFYITNFEKISELTIGVSPIFLGQNINSNNRDHITYLHGIETTSALMKNTLIGKAKKLGYNLNENEFNIEFDLTRPIKTKRILIDNVSNIATQGNVKITGNPDIIGLCYGLGIGRSTGCGFGFVYNVHDNDNL